MALAKCLKCEEEVYSYWADGVISLSGVRSVIVCPTCRTNWERFAQADPLVREQVSKGILAERKLHAMRTEEETEQAIADELQARQDLGILVDRWLEQKETKA